MTYNVLAQKLVKRTVFPYCSKSALKWTSRKQLLIEELSCAADIVCLQEVDSFNEFWKGFLEGTKKFSKLNYEVCCAHGVRILDEEQSKEEKENGTELISESKQDLSFVEGDSESIPAKSHGLIIAFNKAKFGLIRKQTVHFNSDWNGEFGDGNELKSPKVGLMLELEHLETKKRIIVSTSHLYWNPEFHYVRLRQLVFWLHKLNIFALKSESEYVFITGDFNLTPCSELYKFITASNEERIQMISDEAFANQAFPYPSISGGVPNFSKIQELIIKGEIPVLFDVSKVFNLDYSVFTEGWNGILDYVFVFPLKRESNQKLPQLINYLSKPDHSKVTKEVGLPNNSFPSDHIPLLCCVSI